MFTKNRRVKYSDNELQIVEEMMDLTAGYHLELRKEPKGQVRDADFPVEENQLRYALVSNILGKILTVVDASFEDKERREATKSIIKQMVNEERKSFINELYNSYK